MKGLRTSKQLADLQEKRNGLLCLIQNWRAVQLVYLPHVASLLAQSPPPPESTTISSTPEILAKNIPLFLPSALPHHIRNLPELEELCKLERRLREPQADDALASIQRQRRVIQGLWQFKRLNASGIGNRPNMNMLTLYKRFDSKTKRAAEEYRAAWRALRVLEPNGSWSLRLKELKDRDISGPGRDPEDETTSNSRYEPSWIWLVPAATGTTPSAAQISNDEFNDSMRVEWAKARARMMRWKEQLLIVQEEMRRVIEYLRWKAAWWQARTSLRSHYDNGIVSGISGYANKQAAICSRMAEQCASYWVPCLKDKDITPSWASYFPSLSLQRMRRRVIASVGENVLSEAEDVDEENCSDDEDPDLQGDDEDTFDLDD